MRELIEEFAEPGSYVDTEVAFRPFRKSRYVWPNGGREFWVMDPLLREVRVSTLERHTVTYQPHEDVPIPLMGVFARIPVDAIFR